ncbi:DUF3800 domain-containing protein [Trichloromonas sp.]|uniref:DUF3800 domain-containing protein n=1 Tax=Trichloromonas sp. TaxID=3069249 RepID=UPI002A4930B5|nr:DUF3800 domain-containing protein [Trichloromonas sp.]
MLYIAYLDEFGHIGPYVSHDHPSHKTHPVFGLGGIVLPHGQVRCFATYFFQLKNRLLEFELKKSGKHPAKWEKKGAALYTLQNVQKYPELRKATFRLLNRITKAGGFVFYVGFEKRRDLVRHDSKNIYYAALREAIKRLDQECEAKNDQFLLMLDQQEKNVMRTEIVETAALSMFGEEPRKTLIEPPIQAESHLYQNLQCADWICGIVGRMAHYKFEPEQKKDLEVFDRYFKDRLERVSRRSSLRSTK